MATLYNRWIKSKADITTIDVVAILYADSYNSLVLSCCDNGLKERPRVAAMQGRERKKI